MRKLTISLALAAMISLLSASHAHGQTERTVTDAPDSCARSLPLAIKTNLLYDAVTALNFEVEVPFKIKGEDFSAVYEQHLPWWHIKNKFCLQFLTFGGEARWWFLPTEAEGYEDAEHKDSLLGHFAGTYVWGGLGDIQIGRRFGCSQFEFWSVGLTYGYAMPVSDLFNLEFSLSIGYAHIPYQCYMPSNDWEVLIRDPYRVGTLHYFGPTKAEVSLVFPFSTDEIFKRGGKR